MTKRHWTVLIVPDDSGSSRSVRVSGRAVNVFLYTLLVAAVATMVVTWVAVTKTIRISRIDRLQRTNELLAQELQVAERRIGQLADTLDVIVTQNQRVRNLAGLDATDPGVLQAGIGGPAARPGADEAFLQDQVLGSRALDARSDLGALLRRANILVSSFREASDSLENYNQQLLRTPSIRPVARDLSWVTSQFNPSRRHPIYHTIREHPGIDIAADPNTPIVAPADGTVIDAGWQVGYGNGVRIDHGNGIVTYFAHASQILVRQGQRVSRNDPIALVGSTGTSTGPHLHYEVEVDGVNVDPRQFILPEDIVVD